MEQTGEVRKEELEYALVLSWDLVQETGSDQPWQAACLPAITSVPGYPKELGGDTFVVNDTLKLQQEINKIQWYHSIDFGNGIVTPGVDNSAKKLKRLKLPDSLQGKTVLDIGAWDGFFSFEAERRGAQRVLATDSYIWSGSSGSLDKRGFDLAKKYLGSNVDEKLIDVFDLSPEDIGTFDVTLFLGVLYHLKHPLLALQKVASVTKEVAVIETVVDMLSCRRPAMAFYGGDELARDATNWVGPNPAAVAAMLKTVGFRKVQIVSGVKPWFFRVPRAVYYKYKLGHQFWSATRTDRITIHAWK